MVNQKKIHEFMEWDQVAARAKTVIEEWKELPYLVENNLLPNEPTLWHETNQLCGNVLEGLKKGEAREDARNDIAWRYRFHLNTVKAKLWLKAIKYDFKQLIK